MTAPIPLTAPDGTVRAWACGECESVYGADPDHVGSLDTHRRSALWCCATCVLCGVRPASANDAPGRFCEGCIRDGRRAFEVLAAIGMAVAVEEISSAVRAVCEARTCTAREAAEEWARESLAALCGVDVETVRRWRS